jgi:hypothetical protein
MNMHDEDLVSIIHSLQLPGIHLQGINWESNPVLSQNQSRKQLRNIQLQSITM